MKDINDLIHKRNLDYNVLSSDGFHELISAHILDNIELYKFCFENHKEGSPITETLNKLKIHNAELFI